MGIYDRTVGFVADKVRSLGASLSLPLPTDRPWSPGRTSPAEGGRLTGIRREPAIQVWTDFKRADECKGVVQLSRLGYLQLPALFAEQMLWNPRYRGLVETRMDGLIDTNIRWEPGKRNALGRRAAAAIVEDWPKIASGSTRKQLHQWGLILGACPAQKHWYRDPGSKRAIPRVEVYHPSWLSWDWGQRAYRVWTMAGMVYVPSPALTVPGEEWESPYGALGGAMQLADPRQWIIHEPFGQHSWRQGLLGATWSAWLAHEWARRDMARASEKLGLNVLLAKYPKGQGNEAADKKFLDGVRTLHSEGIVPLEQREEGEGGYDLKVLEYTGTGFDMIRGTKDSNAIDLAILYLGHANATDGKGGGVYGPLQGENIRSDIKDFDAAAEFATMRDQVLGDWAEVNFGDRDVAPVAVYETEPPAINLQAAQTLQFVAAAIGQFVVTCPWVDVEGLLERFRIPVLLGDARETAIAAARNAPPRENVKRALAAVMGQLAAVAATDPDAANSALEGWLKSAAAAEAADRKDR